MVRPQATSIRFPPAPDITMERLTLSHRIHYDYPSPVFLGPHILRLSPVLPAGLQDYSLQLTPRPQTLHWQFDLFGNRIARAVFAERAEALDVVMMATFCWHETNPLDFLLEETAVHWPPHYDPDLAACLAPYLWVSERGALFQAFVEQLRKGPASTVPFLAYAAQQIAATVRYTCRLDPGIQDVETTLHERTGSCRDNAWLLVQTARRLGFATRFVSGYLMDLAVKTGDEDPGVDTAALHAWVDVFLPGAGWVAVDPTSGLFAGADHIALAAAPDPALAAPLLGSCERQAVCWHYSHSLRRLDRGTGH